jgi:hypothetical protein
MEKVKPVQPLKPLERMSVTRWWPQSSVKPQALGLPTNCGTPIFRKFAAC